MFLLLDYCHNVSPALDNNMYFRLYTWIQNKIRTTDCFLSCFIKQSRIDIYIRMTNNILYEVLCMYGHHVRFLETLAIDKSVLLQKYSNPKT